MTRPAGGGPRSGFTFIEVVGAFVILAAGVLLALRLTATLAEQMENSALRSEVVWTGQQRLDSLEALPYDSLSPDTVADTLTLRGQTYRRSHEITQDDILLLGLRVAVEPAGSTGPSFEAESFVPRDAW